MKKTFRLLSTILAAVIILTTVAIGFSAFAAYTPDDGLPQNERDQFTDVTIAIKSEHTADENGQLSYPKFNPEAGTLVYGGFSRTVTLTADLTIKINGDEDLAWAPLEGYKWTVNNADYGNSKTITIVTEPEKEYEVIVVVTDHNHSGAAYSQSDSLKFTTPTAAVLDGSSRAALYEQVRLAQFPSQFGYTAESWKPFELAKINAQLVYNNVAATENDVTNATTLLKAAYDTLNDNPNGENEYNDRHDVTVKVDSIGKFFLMIWESIKFAVWDLFLSKIFMFTK
ncbi:MAG: hypothetical protein LBJ12_04625 [Oscillospiraceae bacterium]|nr:hypothetical protein [Oscillospiraceae bacterium]